MNFDEKSKNILRALVSLADQTKDTISISSIDGNDDYLAKKVCVCIPLVVIDEIKANLVEGVQ